MLRIAAFCVLLLPPLAIAADAIAPTVQFERGGVNSVLITRNGGKLAVYRAGNSSVPELQQILLTHHRRDVLPTVDESVEGTIATAPLAEREWFEKPDQFWNAFVANRFHDYAQQSTKILGVPLPIDRWVEEGDFIDWHGLQFEVVATPGYTRGAVSYLVTVDGRRLAFTGDLIYGDGQLLDLYSFQDEIPEANIRGYHGYGSRLAQLISSLRKVAATEPDVLIPARGPLINDPQAAIEKLIGRVQALYHNYLSTNALHWYFKEDRMRLCGDRILGEGADIELMPYSLHEKTPDWVFEHATSRLLISNDGHGFLLDCGYQRVIDAIKKLMDNGVVKQVDGIFVTHYHDDHTDMVQAAAEEFSCPVYSTVEYQDILENPAAYHMPAMTSNAIQGIHAVPSGQSMKWQEFDLTFQFFPGQTIYHGALLVRRAKERPIYFIGDAFAPSGIDDYCLLNRNLVHDDGGYRLCFQKLRAIGEPFWLVNEHIPYVFEFSGDELDYLERRYDQRVEILRDLFPWDSPNYGVDEQWAVFYPYGANTKSNEHLHLAVRVTNHSPTPREFKIRPHLPDGISLVQHDSTITLAPGQSGKCELDVRVAAGAGNYVITADVSSEGMEFLNWTECLVTVE